MKKIFELKEERINQLLSDELSISQLNQLEKAEYVLATWGIDGYALLSYIDSTKTNYKKMNFKNFLSYCSPCGGDWGQMVLTGIKRLYPTIYEMIPEDMGIFAFTSLIELLNVLNIDTYENGD